MKVGFFSLAFLALFALVLSEGENVDKAPKLTPTEDKSSEPADKADEPSEPTDKAIMKARVESCTHELKRIHQARTFVGQDMNFFHNVEFKNVPTKFPDLLFLNAADEVVERVHITNYSREKINELLMKKGFFKKSHIDQVVPEKYRNGPYVGRDEL